jgi:hypothetical protein
MRADIWRPACSALAADSLELVNLSKASAEDPQQKTAAKETAKR